MQTATEENRNLKNAINVPNLIHARVSNNSIAKAIGKEYGKNCCSPCFES